MPRQPAQRRPALEPAGHGWHTPATIGEIPISETDDALLIGIASEIVTACAAKNHVPAAELLTLVSTVHAALAGFGAPQPAVEPGKPVPAVAVRRSATDDRSVRLEDGKRHRAFKRHLTTCGLTPTEDRANGGLPADRPTVSPTHARKRRDLAGSTGFGSTRKAE